jgi:hypothetical protein
VTTNRQVDAGGKKTDLDVVILDEHVVYIFECKHSIPATSPHEMRDLWEDIEKGARQLKVAMEILSDRERLLNFLAGWFPGTKRNQVLNLTIRPCVLCSHRIFSGIEHDGIPVRDSGALLKLVEDGTVAMGWVDESGESIMYRYRVCAAGGFSSPDLGDFLSPESKFFKMFSPFMHPVSRFKKLGTITLASETYMYEVGLPEWMAHLESLGCTRLPDERKKLNFPWTPEDLLSGFKPPPSGSN